LVRSSVRVLPQGRLEDIGASDPVDSVEGKIVVVAPSHGGVEALARRSLIAELLRVVRRDLGAVELSLGRCVDQEDLGGVAGAGKCGVGPVAGEVVGVADDAGPLHGAPGWCGR
jgi:hypothetical protein